MTTRIVKHHFVPLAPDIPDVCDVCSLKPSHRYHRNVPSLQERYEVEREGTGRGGTT